MRFLAQQTEWLDTPHPTIAGWELYDEIDMQRDPAAGCAELAGIIAGLPADGRIRFNNFGKGVAFWQTDAEAECYVNTPGLDVVSADTYWFTDENLCGPSEGGAWFGGRQLEPDECHLAANYGLTVDRVRYLDGLDGDRKPVWAMVEVGHPFAEEDWPTITPDQVRAAVWHSVIAGAEGIVYFNHSFGGPCPTQHALREPCYAETRAMVATVNGQLHELAPVLAGTPADDVAADGPVRITARHDDGGDLCLRWGHDRGGRGGDVHRVRGGHRRGHVRGSHSDLDRWAVLRLVRRRQRRPHLSSHLRARSPAVTTERSATAPSGRRTPARRR